ncbi:filamentous hemagglutinin N-terminal domain-containing protein [Pelatocladus sp. BLCC-F211]|uniref:two-partner secretion domain-containing protein n=1 Tax=Pelatocladus sp. BLCC-F211 TaxID=3342752 RepID=UPI0035B8B52B
MIQPRRTFVLFTLPIAILETLAFITIAQAQITPDTSLGTENSIVNPDVINGIPSDRIEGGATRGSSLFHSFQEFNVGEGRGAYFSNPANITNILTRVTGGNPSNILGKLGVLGNANLFLLNPKGIFFGPNASLDLGGSFFGTTADSFIFNNNFEFSATNPQAVPLLSVNIPIGLRFRENPGSIRIQGDGQGLRSYTDEVINTISGLRVQPNQTLALVGGDIFLEGATLKTAGGRIELGSVAGSGLVSITPINKGFALGYGNVQNFGNIQLSQQASVDASGLGGGDIQVWGRRITLANGSQIEASTLGDQQGGLLSVNATEQLEAVGISSDGRFPSALATQAYPGTTGAAGDLIVNTGELLVRDGAQISASTFGQGNAGIVKINATGNITADVGSEISSAINFSGVGSSGGIEINTKNLLLTNSSRINASTNGQGKAGIVKINATGDITVDGGSEISSTVDSSAIGNSGGIEITTNNLFLTDGAEITASTFGEGNAGIVKINATGDISADGGSEISSTVGFFAEGNSSGIEINTKNLFLTNGGQINASTFGIGNAGRVIINATGNILASGESNDGFRSGILSQVNQTAEGDAGGIQIITKDLTLSDGAYISASTFGTGDAGKIIINATGNISASGESNKGFPDGIFSQVSQETAEGNAGGIEIITKDLSLTEGALISATTFGTGNAGKVIINATGKISVDGEDKEGSRSGIFSQVDPTAEGNSGGIQISTKDLSLTNGGQISASTLGTGNAGRIIINATGKISASGETNNGSSSGIFSEVYSSVKGDAGGIQISTKDLSLTDGGRISASTFGQGNAGSVIINATGKISASGETKNGSRSGIFSQVGEYAQGNSDGIQISAKDLFLSDGGRINASTFGDGNAGIIIINATNLVSIDGESDIFSRAESPYEVNAGGIQINTKDLSLTNGGQISGSTYGNGNAGRVFINATGNISIDGEDKQGFLSGIFSRVVEDAKGNSGGIEINTNNLSLTDGAIIDASTSGTGNAGSVIINATGNISASGQTKNGRNSRIFSGVTSSGVGNAGGIKINARSLSLSNGAILSANSEGTGAAGNIEVTTAKDIRLNNRALITATTKGDQGNIFLNSRDLILRRNSNITTNATGTATGGNIRIVTGNFVALENSDITANAEKGFGGNIFIKAAYRFSSPDSDITAASDLGTEFSGTVQINNTDVNPSQGLMQLPDNPTDASNQIAQNPCQKGFGSTFLITGRGGVPSSPNDSFTNDNVRVDLAQPVSSSSLQAVTINQPKNSATTKEIVPARGWIFNEKGEIVLTAYDVNSIEFQRQYLRQNTVGCRAF